MACGCNHTANTPNGWGGVTPAFAVTSPESDTSGLVRVQPRPFLRRALRNAGRAIRNAFRPKNLLRTVAGLALLPVGVTQAFLRNPRLAATVGCGVVTVMGTPAAGAACAGAARRAIGVIEAMKATANVEQSPQAVLQFFAGDEDVASAVTDRIASVAESFGDAEALLPLFGALSQPEDWDADSAEEIKQRLLRRMPGVMNLIRSNPQTARAIVDYVEGP